MAGIAGVSLLLACGAAQAGDEVQALFRLRRDGAMDRILTTSCEERHSVVSQGHYVPEGVEGAVFRAAGPGRVALYRFVAGGTGRHLFTTARQEGAGRQFRLEAVVGYLAQAPGPGLVPLVRLYDRRRGDHLYTTDQPEAVRLQKTRRYAVESVMGYVSDRREDPCPIS